MTFSIGSCAGAHPGCRRAYVPVVYAENEVELTSRYESRCPNCGRQRAVTFTPPQLVLRSRRELLDVVSRVAHLPAPPPFGAGPATQ